MCRFITYKGKVPIILKTLLKEAQNSLISQSRLAKETKTGLNADGFGVGWYDLGIDEEPAVFKSIQPAWSDDNLLNISAKIQSDCFIGHVRASTVGTVNISNCHPFTFQNLLFAHNGTIRNFDKIKKDLLFLLDEEYFSQIKGQTDSEHLFYLVCNSLKNKTLNASNMAHGYASGIQQINKLFVNRDIDPYFKINAVITNGKEITAVRYVSDINQASISLYYSINKENGQPKSVIISSEPLNSFHEEWEQIPINHILTVDEAFNVEIQPISKYEIV